MTSEKPEYYCLYCHTLRGCKREFGPFRKRRSKGRGHRRVSGTGLRVSVGPYLFRFWWGLGYRVTICAGSSPVTEINTYVLNEISVYRRQKFKKKKKSTVLASGHNAVMC